MKPRRLILDEALFPCGMRMELSKKVELGFAFTKTGASGLGADTARCSGSSMEMHLTAEYNYWSRRQGRASLPRYWNENIDYIEPVDNVTI